MITASVMKEIISKVTVSTEANAKLTLTLDIFLKQAFRVGR